MLQHLQSWKIPFPHNNYSAMKQGNSWLFVPLDIVSSGIDLKVFVGEEVGMGFFSLQDVLESVAFHI